LGLAVLFAILYGRRGWRRTCRERRPLLASLGFLLLAGTLMSQLIEVLRVPHLTGYLLAGILAGPHVLHLIDTASVKALAPVTRSRWRSLRSPAAPSCASISSGRHQVAGGVERRADGLHHRDHRRRLLLARPLLPFTAGLTFSGLVAAALLWGIIATSRSPSATLASSRQTRAPVRSLRSRSPR